jgi:uncharacterized protein YjeT (DUF2065 family)
MNSISSIYKEIFSKLIGAPGQSRAAKTVEVFGWLILIEGSAVILFPRFAASALHLPALVQQGENYFRLVGLLVSGAGMLYVASGRLNGCVGCYIRPSKVFPRNASIATRLVFPLHDGSSLDPFA